MLLSLAGTRLLLGSLLSGLCLARLVPGSERKVLVRRGRSGGGFGRGGRFLRACHRRAKHEHQENREDEGFHGEWPWSRVSLCPLVIMLRAARNAPAARVYRLVSNCIRVYRGADPVSRPG